MNKITPAGNEKTVYSGKIFQIVEKPMNVGGDIKYFEIARRAPGVRVLIVHGNQILLTREFRTELDGYDYRLPGGKVFDTLEEYLNALDNNVEIDNLAREAAARECKEETGIVANHLDLFRLTKAGATIEWDLYYYIVNSFEEREQNLEDGEVIHPKWQTFEEAKKLCLTGKMKEDRSAGVLLQFLGSQECICEG